MLNFLTPKHFKNLKIVIIFIILFAMILPLSNALTPQDIFNQNTLAMRLYFILISGILFYVALSKMSLFEEKENLAKALAFALALFAGTSISEKFFLWIQSSPILIIFLSIFFIAVILGFETESTAGKILKFITIALIIGFVAYYFFAKIPSTPSTELSLINIFGYTRRTTLFYLIGLLTFLGSSIIIWLITTAAIKEDAAFRNFFIMASVSVMVYYFHQFIYELFFYNAPFPWNSLYHLMAGINWVILLIFWLYALPFFSSAPEGVSGPSGGFLDVLMSIFKGIGIGFKGIGKGIKWTAVGTAKGVKWAAVKGAKATKMAGKGIGYASYVGWQAVMKRKNMLKYIDYLLRYFLAIRKKISMELKKVKSSRIINSQIISTTNQMLSNIIHFLNELSLDLQAGRLKTATRYVSYFNIKQTPTETELLFSKEKDLVSVSGILNSLFAIARDLVMLKNQIIVETIKVTKPYTMIKSDENISEIIVTLQELHQEVVESIDITLIVVNKIIDEIKQLKMNKELVKQKLLSKKNESINAENNMNDISTSNSTENNKKLSELVNELVSASNKSTSNADYSNKNSNNDSNKKIEATPNNEKRNELMLNHLDDLLNQFEELNELFEKTLIQLTSFRPRDLKKQISQLMKSCEKSFITFDQFIRKLKRTNLIEETKNRVEILSRIIKNIKKLYVDNAEIIVNSIFSIGFGGYKNMNERIKVYETYIKSFSDNVIITYSKIMDEIEKSEELEDFVNLIYAEIIKNKIFNMLYSMRYEVLSSEKIIKQGLLADLQKLIIDLKIIEDIGHAKPLIKSRLKQIYKSISEIKTNLQYLKRESSQSPIVKVLSNNI